VSWHNIDSVKHTVTSNSPDVFDSGPILPGRVFERGFDTPGTFGYHCLIHGEAAESGNIVVQ
jgi:plastocyanin